MSLAKVEELIASRRNDLAAKEISQLVAAEAARNFDWPRAIGLARKLGDADTAITAARKWARAGKKDPQRRLLLIELLLDAGAHKEAALLARGLRKDEGGLADAHFLEGLVDARLGDFTRAAASFRKALEAAPQHTSAWEQIALMRAHEDLAADIDAMERLNRALLPPAFRIPLLFALGRAYDTQGDTAKAFARIAEGARATRAAAPFSLAPQLAYVERLKQTFREPLFERLRDRGEGGDGLIFIIGAQRSGTTLVEQILASARGVTPTGEHTLLRLSTHALGSMEPPEMARAAEMPAEAWRAMAADYVAHVKKRFGASERYTDKTLINHFFAGVIAILFPKAKIVWCRRDPRDVVWSCFRTRINANRWANDLQDAIAYVKAYDSLCAHWKSVLGERVHAIQYEELVRRPAETAAGFFAHCGLAAPDDWQDFYKSPRAVATASLAQVREPLNPNAIGSWRRYEEFLGPVYAQHFR